MASDIRRALFLGGWGYYGGYGYGHGGYGGGYYHGYPYYYPYYYPWAYNVYTATQQWCYYNNGGTPPPTPVAPVPGRGVIAICEHALDRR